MQTWKKHLALSVSKIKLQALNRKTKNKVIRKSKAMNFLASNMFAVVLKATATNISVKINFTML